MKRVSRGLRSAARRALTRGRWRPIIEQWANATDAANFFGEFLWGDGGDHIAELEMFRGMSRHWRDRDKAAAFVAIQQDIFDDIQRQIDEDWEAEHGWKYGPSGDKFWEEDEEEMLGLA